MRLLLGLVVLAAGCIGSIDGIEDTSSNNPDGGNTTHTPDAPKPPCKNKVTAVGDGHHYPGMDCQEGCHNHNFSLSGTLFTGATGTTPIVGATITVKDAAGSTFEMVSQTNGNFYSGNTMQFPVTVVASSCPDAHAMVAKIMTPGGCAAAGCHVAGSTTGNVYLP